MYIKKNSSLKCKFHLTTIYRNLNNIKYTYIKRKLKLYIKKKCVRHLIIQLYLKIKIEIYLFRIIAMLNPVAEELFKSLKSSLL